MFLIAFKNKKFWPLHKCYFILSIYLSWLPKLNLYVFFVFTARYYYLHIFILFAITFFIVIIDYEWYKLFPVRFITFLHTHTHTHILSSTDCFIVSQLFSVARHTGCFKLGLKPTQLYTRLDILLLSYFANLH